MKEYRMEKCCFNHGVGQGFLMFCYCWEFQRGSIEMLSPLWVGEKGLSDRITDCFLAK